MRALTEAERQYLTETQSLTLDEAGRDVSMRRSCAGQAGSVEVVDAIR